MELTQLSLPIPETINTWKPIETAPKEATRWYLSPKQVLPEILVLGEWENGIHKATHWMHLPEPPKQ